MRVEAGKGPSGLAVYVFADLKKGEAVFALLFPHLPGFHL